MFSGSMVAIVTPMTADGALDWPAWDRLLDFHVREGTDGIVIAGTTGESPALALEEVEELTRRAVARCAGKLKLIVGAGTHATASTVARTTGSNIWPTLPSGNSLGLVTISSLPVSVITR